MKAINALLGAGKYDDAIKRLQGLQPGYPGSASLRAELAIAYMYNSKFDEAVKSAEGALKIEPHNHEAHWVLANVYMFRGMNEKGFEEYQLAAKYPSKKPCKQCLKLSQQVLKNLKK